MLARGCVQHRLGAIQRIAKQAVDLLDAALVHAALFHHLEQDRQVDRHGGNGGAGLGDHRLEHRHARIAAARRQPRADVQHPAVEILLRGADGAVPVDIPGQLLADVRVGRGLGAGGEHVRLVQRLDPHLPVLAAHNRHGVVDFRLGGRLEMEFLHLFLVRVDAFLRGRRADRLEGRVVCDTGARMLAPRGRQAVHDEVHVSHVRADLIDRTRLDLVAERVAVDAARIQPRLLGRSVECRRVVPARRPRLALGAGLFKEDSQRLGPTAERRDDAGSKAVAGRCADHQHAFRAAPHGTLGTHVIDLPLHVAGAALGMGGGAEKAANAGLDDHRCNLFVRAVP